MRQLVYLALLLASLSGCGLLEQRRFATMEECRIARRLETIDDEALFQCVVDRLPETLF